MRCLVLLLPLLVGIVQADQCADVKNTFNQCTRNAHQEYVDAMKKGDDGRPAFRARKTCNYLVAAIEVKPDQNALNIRCFSYVLAYFVSAN